MPIYEYRCQHCGRTLEKRQKFSDPALTVCPYCSGELEKLISAPAVQFKGGGWYADLYSSSKGKPAAAGEGAPAASGSSEGSSATPASSSSDSSSSGKSGGSSSDSSSSGGASSSSTPSTSVPAASTPSTSK